MKAQEVKQVIDWLEQYRQNSGATPLAAADFAEWLHGQEGGEEPVLPPNADGLISMYLGFMANYAAFYARRVFRQLDLYSMTDWAFLATLQRASQLTKSDLIQQNILEKSTGTEVLKRLGKQGYIRELPNPEDRRAKLAIDIFCHRARKYIGAYFVELEGKVDALVFTGGIGENAPTVRSRICQGLESIGLSLDEKRNATMHSGQNGQISTDDSRLHAFVFRTNEELLIARDTVRVVKNAPRRW